MAGKVTINAERCKGCNLCVAVCPNGCLVISKTSNENGYFPPEAKCDDCNACAMCAVVCCDTLIEVYRDNNNVITIEPKKSKAILIKEKT